MNDEMCGTARIYEETVQILADEGIKIYVNTLRKVTAGMGEMPTRVTKLGSVKFTADAAGRRIVVTTDGGRVRLHAKGRGRTKKGHKRSKPACQKQRHILASRKCLSHHPHSSMDQSRTSRRTLPPN